MFIGVPREIKINEFRVGLIPAAVRILIDAGHQVIIQADAGKGSGIPNEEYIKAGAALVETRNDVYDQAEMIIKVKEPLPQECEFIKEGQIILSFLHLAAVQELTQALLKSKCVGIAYETIQLEDGSLPILTPMSEVAGRLAPQVGAFCLEKAHGGRGVLLAGVPGVDRGKVTIIGGGVVGTNAAKIAIGLGAEVYIVDINPRRLAYLDDIFGNSITTIASNPQNIIRLISISDLVIGAVLIPGALTPKVVTREMISNMQSGAVVVDVSIDQGGCFETSRPTTHQDPTFSIHEVIHYCVTNIPSTVPRTSTYALANVTLPYILETANKGIKRAIKENCALARGINIYKGVVTNPKVAESMNCDCEKLLQILN